ncbi:MAG: B12-binding domain-containing radical SAM protein [Candidatus Omnitrophica bacterium]|nr:B12-binding domain-containing radical SAM protein [Candidatus Omnitrophota bacterium]
MKLLLVNPNFNKSSVVVPSLGLGFLATYIKKYTDWMVEVCEPVLQGISMKETLDKVKSADILGLVCYTESRFFCFDFAKRTKKLNPACKIIVGGPHVDILDIKILEHYSFIDIVARSEAEETLLEIIQNKPLEEIQGITFRKNNQIFRNSLRPLIHNLDKLEFDYDLYQPWINNWKDNEVDESLKELKHLPIITSRGCPFSCFFCSAPSHWQFKLRTVSPKRRAQWLKDLTIKYNIGYFRFYDSLFINNEKDIMEFCDILEDMNLKINFRIDIRVGTPRHILQRLKSIGCRIVGFGIESNSDKILIKINKGIDTKTIRETIDDCKKLGLWLIGFFMFSLPGEKLKDIRKTLSIFKYFDVLNIQIFKIHPNTFIYHQLCMDKKIDDEVWFNNNYGYNSEAGNHFFFCRDLFKEAIFSHKEIALIISYAYELRNFQGSFYKISFLKQVPLFIRFIFIKMVLNSVFILKLYNRMLDTLWIKKTKALLRYFKICR